MVALPPRPEQKIINSIYAAIEKERADSELYLGRLGSSFIGNECIRQIWLEWRGFARESFSGRMLRLFDTGHEQETRIVKDLRRAGYEVWDKRDDGKQFEFGDETGHFVTKMDGVIKGVPESEKTAHALEIKSHNKDSFAGLLKKSIEYSKPAHYAQVQITMMLSKLTRTLYVAVNKDNEQFYVERIKEDKPYQEKLKNKIIKLTEARMRPAGLSDDASSFGCKFCGLKDVCTRKVEPIKSCRSCAMCSPAADGAWLCELKNETLTLDQQRAACEHYEGL